VFFSSKSVPPTVPESFGFFLWWQVFSPISFFPSLFLRVPYPPLASGFKKTFFFPLSLILLVSPAVGELPLHVAFEQFPRGPADCSFRSVLWAFLLVPCPTLNSFFLAFRPFPFSSSLVVSMFSSPSIVYDTSSI